MSDESPDAMLDCDKRMLALEECKLLQQKIGDWGRQIYTIRGWILTILAGLTVAVITARVPPLGYLLVCLFSILPLFISELVEAAWQRKAIRRAAIVEEALRGEREYDGPRIGDSLSANASFQEIWYEFGKHLTRVFYFGILVAVLMVCVVAWWAQRDQVPPQQPTHPPASLLPP